MLACLSKAEGCGWGAKKEAAKLKEDLNAAMAFSGDKQIAPLVKSED